MTSDRINILKQTLFNAVQKVTQENSYPALLGDAVGNLAIVDNGKANFYYCRVLKPTGVNVTEVRCTSVLPAYNLEVFVRTSPIDGVLEVVSLNYSKSTEFYDGYPIGNTGIHASQHGYYGADPLRLEGLQFSPLLTSPSQDPSLTVNLSPLTAIVDNEWFGFLGGAIDLSSYVPSDPDVQLFILTGIDGDGLPQVLTNALPEDEYDSDEPAVPYDLSDITAFAFDETFTPSAMVRLYTGQTRIDNWDIFADARLWLSGGNSGSSGGDIRVLAEMGWFS